MEEEEDDDEPHQIPSVLKALVFACMAGAVTWMIVTDNINHAIDSQTTSVVGICNASDSHHLPQHGSSYSTCHIHIQLRQYMFQQYCNRKTTYVSTDDEERPLLVETDEIQIICPASPPLPCSSSPILQL